MKFFGIVLLIGLAAASAPPRRVPRLFQSECDVQCIEIFAPVCASNGITYDNECYFGIAACESAQNNDGAVALTFTAGACGETSCAGFIGIQCDDFFTCVDVVNDGCDPEDGGSDCIGFCQPASCEAFCTEQYDPVCASNGESYDNECYFGIAACEFAHNNIGADALTFTAGACAAPCDAFCPATFDPVCASNGVTYSNDCTFGVAACESAQNNIGADILTFTEGACGETSCAGFLGIQCDDFFTCVDVVNDGCDPEDGGSDCIGFCQPALCDTFCPALYDPVCGSNGETYSNGCMFGAFACEYAHDNVGADALSSTEGECEEECDQQCTKEFIPVCGSNGVSYDNECMYGIAACEFAKANPGADALSFTEGACEVVLPEVATADESTEEPSPRRRGRNRRGRNRRGRRRN